MIPAKSTAQLLSNYCVIPTSISSYRKHVEVSVYQHFCLSDCHHNLAAQSISAPPCHIDRKGGWHKQQNTGSRATPSRGRGVLSLRDNPEAILTAIKPALPLNYNFELRFWPLVGL